MIVRVSVSFSCIKPSASYGLKLKTFIISHNSVAHLRNTYGLVNVIGAGYSLGYVTHMSRMLAAWLFWEMGLNWDDSFLLHTVSHPSVA